MTARVRPPIEQTLMKIAHDWREQSTCPSWQVGAVLVRGRHQLAAGYNGAAAGLEHCTHAEFATCNTAQHAERNVVTNAALNGTTTRGAALFITASPCADCAGTLINAGIVEVVYDVNYISRRWGDGRPALEAVGILVRKLAPMTDTNDDRR